MSLIFEDSLHETICKTLLMSGEYEDYEEQIEYKAWEILDNPHIYPEYFPNEQIQY